MATPPKGPKPRAQGPRRALLEFRRAWARIHDAFHNPSTAIHGKVQTIVWVMIIFSILLFVLEMALDGTLGLDTGLEAASLTASLSIIDVVDKGVLIFFMIELLLRIGTFRPPALKFYKKSKLRTARVHLLGRLVYCLEPLNLVDILTVLALVPALRSLRALRLLRLVRSSNFLRYSNPVLGVARAFDENKLLFSLGFSLLGTATVVGGISIFLIENTQNENINSVGDGLWWALVTLTTVGFGDISPVTALGRAAGGVLMIAGMFTLALFAGIVGSTLLNSLLSIREEQFRMSTHMNHIVVCGYDPGSRMLLNELLNELREDGRDIVVFAKGERPQEVPPEFIWISGDPTKESELDKVRMPHASAAILVGSRDLLPQQSDASTILTAFTVRSYLKDHPIREKRAMPLYIVAEILDAENVEHALTAGADEVIETTRLGFSLLAHAVAVPGSAAIMGKVAATGAHSLYTGAVPRSLKAPLSFEKAASQIKKSYGVMLIGIRDLDTGKEHINPPESLVITEGAELIYLAERKTLPEVPRTRVF